MIKKILVLALLCLMIGSALGQPFYRVDESRYNYPPDFEIYRSEWWIDIEMGYDPAAGILYIPTYSNWNNPWNPNESFDGGFNGWGMPGKFDPHMARQWLEVNYYGGPDPVYNHFR